MSKTLKPDFRRSDKIPGKKTFNEKIKGYKMENVVMSEKGQNRVTTSWTIILVSIMVFATRLIITNIFGEVVAGTIIDIIVYVLDGIFGIGIITGGLKLRNASNEIKKNQTLHE